MIKLHVLALIIGLVALEADASDRGLSSPLFTKEAFFSMSDKQKEVAIKEVKKEQVAQEWEFLLDHTPSEKQLPAACCASAGCICLTTATYGCATGMAAGCLLYTSVFGTAAACALRHGQKAVQQELDIIKEWQNNKNDKED